VVGQCVIATFSRVSRETKSNEEPNPKGRIKRLRNYIAFFQSHQYYTDMNHNKLSSPTKNCIYIDVGKLENNTSLVYFANVGYKAELPFLTGCSSENMK